MDAQDNPPFPYARNDILTVRSHTPPPPVTTSEVRRRAPFVGEQTLSPIELCLQNPPLPGCDGTTVASIKLLQELHVGNDKRAQLFVVRCVDSGSSYSPPTDQDLVAKIYDPFCCDFDFDDEDPFLGADYDYTHECAAYMRLSHLQGSVVPRFFGSYTLQIHIDTRVRLVRLILIEKIDGLSMDKLTPEAFPMAERQEIMKQIVDGESSLYANDVRHADFRPRNVMVERNDARTLRVVIVDLGKSVIGRSRHPEDSAEESRYFPGVAISPLLRWNVYYRWPDVFRQWIDWSWQPWLEEQYKDTEAAITQEQRERWPIYDWMLKSKPSPPPR